MKREFTVEVRFTMDDDTSTTSVTTKTVQQKIRALLRTHGRGYLPRLKVVRIDAGENT
jgi:hypothetical protein